MIISNNRLFLSQKLSAGLKTIQHTPVEFKLSRDDKAVPVVNSLPLHSLYYPLREGKKIPVSGNRNELVVAIGMGAAYHLVELAKIRGHILIIPVDLNLLYNVLSKIDLSQYFNKDQISIILPEEICDYFDYFTYSSYTFVIHHVLEKIYPAPVLQAIKTIKQTLAGPILDANTQRKFGKIWLKNIITNVKRITEHTFDFASLTIDNKPVLITGAGPSLAHTISQVKDRRHHLFVATTDTALKVLLKHGVIPDAVFSFDAQHYTYYHFTGIKEISRLFIDFTSNLKLDVPTTLLFSNHPLKMIFTKLHYNPTLLPSTTMNIGGGITGFFMENFPDHPIITTGIDYGVYKNSMYANGTYISEYKHMNERYYNTAETIDTTLLYKKNYINHVDDWKADRLFDDYKQNMYSGKNLYSLSSSPFIPYKRISTLDDVIHNAQSIPAKTLPFTMPQFTKNDFYEMFCTTSDNNPEIMYSYFLSLHKKPDASMLNNLKKTIKKWLDV